MRNSVSEGGAERTQQEIADLQGVSRSMIHIVEQRALKKIRKAIEREAAAAGVSPLEWLFGEDED